MTLPRFWDVGAAEGEEEGEERDFGTVLSLPALMRRLGMDAVGEEGEEEEEEEEEEEDSGYEDSGNDSDDG